MIFKPDRVLPPCEESRVKWTLGWTAMAHLAVFRREHSLCLGLFVWAVITTHLFQTNTQALIIGPTFSQNVWFFFFFNSPGCWWVLQWLMFLTLNWTKSKDSSPLNPLMCAVCVYNRSLRFVSFCIYPGICVWFWVLLPLCTGGLRMAIYNGSEEKSLQAFSLKSWSNRAAGALMQQEAKSDKYDQ